MQEVGLEHLGLHTVMKMTQSEVVSILLQVIWPYGRIQIQMSGGLIARSLWSKEAFFCYVFSCNSCENVHSYDSFTMLQAGKAVVS